MNGDERKAFLQFATGCSSLPPGGLANLNPRLTIVRKVRFFCNLFIMPNDLTSLSFTEAFIDYTHFEGGLKRNVGS